MAWASRPGLACWIAPILALLLGIACPTAARAAEPKLDLELATAPDFPADQSRDWFTMLNALSLSSVRIRQGREDDQPSITSTGSEKSPAYRVVGILTENNRLLLPGGKFTLRDRAELAKWIEKAKQGGEEALTAKTAAFGLLAKQLVEVHEALATKVDFSTVGERPSDVVANIAKRLPLKLVRDSAAEKGFAEEEKMTEELNGLSSGTTLAAVLRPLGLVLVPERGAGKQLQLRITDSKSAAEHWPVGWPPKGNPRETLPELSKTLTVEIEDQLLTVALDAVKERIKVPILLDQNNLVRHQVDLAAAKVNMPKVKTFYGKIIERALASARLHYELRVDEADTPFLWITTNKQ